MKKIRNCVSCITKEQCESFRKASISVQPVNKPICDKLDTYEVIKMGNKAMENDDFILSRGIKYV